MTIADVLFLCVTLHPYLTALVAIVVVASAVLARRAGHRSPRGQCDVGSRGQGVGRDGERSRKGGRRVAEVEGPMTSEPSTSDNDAARRDSERIRDRSQRGPFRDEFGVQQQWSGSEQDAERWRREMAK